MGKNERKLKGSGSNVWCMGVEERRSKVGKIRGWVGEMGQEKGIKYLKVGSMCDLLKIT